jgi:hypothetical protein
VSNTTWIWEKTPRGVEFRPENAKIGRNRMYFGLNRKISAGTVNIGRNRRNWPKLVAAGGGTKWASPMWTENHVETQI